MSDPVLQLNGVSKTYNAGQPGEIRVLDGVSLDIQAGEMVALVAPSGAGKSTLLHIAGLLDTADEGEMQLLGRDMRGLTDQQRTRARREEIGFVYQFHHLLPEFSARENVTLPQLANGIAQSKAVARADLLLDQVGILGRATHRPAEMSGGEQQRVALCRALANAPRLLLADEPTGNLDPETSEQVFSALQTLTREAGMASLIATHNLDLAARMDRVLKLEHGSVIAVN